MTIDDVPEYVVEKILDHRTRRRHPEYLIKWTGYPDHDASWEPLANLANAQEILREYEASRSMPRGGGSNVMVLQTDQLVMDQLMPTPDRGTVGGTAHESAAQLDGTAHESAAQLAAQHMRAWHSWRHSI